MFKEGSLEGCGRQFLLRLYSVFQTNKKLHLKKKPLFKKVLFTLLLVVGVAGGGGGCCWRL